MQVVTANFLLEFVEKHAKEAMDAAFNSYVCNKPLTVQQQQQICEVLIYAKVAAEKREPLQPLVDDKVRLRLLGAA